jgi:uncharacterized CHY-type Zn-finger protein
MVYDVSDRGRTDVAWNSPVHILWGQVATMIPDVKPIGLFVICPHCEKELRIAREFYGQDVSCKHCQGPFRLNLRNKMIQSPAFYTECPHCSEELRAAAKYMGKEVACKLCGGAIRFVPF